MVMFTSQWVDLSNTLVWKIYSIFQQNVFQQNYDPQGINLTDCGDSWPFLSQEEKL